MTSSVKYNSFAPAITKLAAVAFVALALGARAIEPGLQTAPTPSPLGNLPLYFEANRGQTDAAFPFLARGRGCNFFVSPNQALLTLTRFDAPAAATRDERANTPGGRLSVTRQLRFDFVGANRDARLVGDGELPGKANYFLGSDPAQWSSGVSLFTRIRVEQIYSGVDLVYYGNARRLEYDFVLAPKTDPAVLAIRFTGADRIRVDRDGNLVFTLGHAEISQPKPLVYQVVRGQRKEIAGGYQLADPRTVTFKLGDYDRELPLVIDPILSYARYFGGNAPDIGWDLALDTSGDGQFVYVAGETMSAGLPITTGTNYSGGSGFGGDAFVAKFDLNSTTANPVYLTYLGGSGDDAALALAVDSDGNAYITGFTTSTNFPHPNGIFTNLHGTANSRFGLYPQDAFVAKLYSTGTLAYATYLGGSTNDVGVGIALDAARNVYVTGYTGSKDFYTTNALYGTNAGLEDAFVAKLNNTGDAFLYSTYLGGTNVDHGEGIVADDAGYAYVTGFTASTNFPNTNAVQQFLNSKTNANFIGAYDVFISKLSPAGDQLAYSTYLGGGRNDIGFLIALDSQTNVYVTGSTLSVDFPVFPVANTNLPRGVVSATLFPDVFVAKFDSVGHQIYTVMFGGTNVDEGWDLAVDTAGQVHVVGETYSTNYPTVGAYELLRSTNSGGADVFVTVLNSNGTAFVRSALLGGATNDYAYGIKLDAAGNDYFVGRTYSTNFPTLAPFASTFGGGTNDAFIAKIGIEPTLNIAPAAGDVLLSWQGYGFLLQANTNLLGTNGWVSLGGVPNYSNGVYSGFLPATRDSFFFRLINDPTVRK
jgi:hypothetical protein